jgi:hypothetical protein
MLKILIIPEHMQRGERVLDAVHRKETELIISRTKNMIRTQGGTEYVAVLPEVRFLCGQRADQIILDYAFVHSLKREVNAILRNSCVPEAFQVMDDRDVLNFG